jgi:hypothetical protein
LLLVSFQTKLLENKIDLPKDAAISGDCKEQSRDIALTWGDGVYSLAIHFALNVGEHLLDCFMLFLSFTIVILYG